MYTKVYIGQFGWHLETSLKEHTPIDIFEQTSTFDFHWEPQAIER